MLGGTQDEMMGSESLTLLALPIRAARADEAALGVLLLRNSCQGSFSDDDEALAAAVCE